MAVEEWMAKESVRGMSFDVEKIKQIGRESRQARAKGQGGAKAKKRVTPLQVLSLGVAAFGWYSPQDFMRPGWKRRAVSAAGVTASFALYLLAGEARLQQDPAVRADEDKLEQQRLTVEQEFGENAAGETAAEEAGGADQAAAGNNEGKNKGLAALVLLGLGGLFGGILALQTMFDNAVIRALRRRGVAYPATVWAGVNCVAACAAIVFDDDVEIVR